VKLGVRSDANELAYAVMFEWFGAVSDKVERNDTPLIEAWQKGEEGELVFEKSFDPIRVDDVSVWLGRIFVRLFVRGSSLSILSMRKIIRWRIVCCLILVAY
jgi:hypothetical protein